MWDSPQRHLMDRLVHAPSVCEKHHSMPRASATLRHRMLESTAKPQALLTTKQKRTYVAPTLNYWFSCFSKMFMPESLVRQEQTPLTLRHISGSEHQGNPQIRLSLIPRLCSLQILCALFLAFSNCALTDTQLCDT